MKRRLYTLDAFTTRQYAGNPLAVITDGDGIAPATGARHTVTSYDAWYVALAEALKLPLATLDETLSKSNGVACEFLTPGP